MSVRLEPWVSDGGTVNELANPEPYGVSPSLPEPELTTASLTPKNLTAPLQAKLSADRKLKQSDQQPPPVEGKTNADESTWR